MSPSDYPEDTQQTSILIYKLKWLMIFRIVVVTILLGSALVLQVKTASRFPLQLLYSLIILSYVVTALTAYFLRYISHLVLYAYVQIIYDLFLETSIVFLTGGIESIFTFTYIFTIIAASILLFRRGALLTASLSTILYGALIDLQFYRLLPSYLSLQFPSSVNSSAMYYNMFFNACAFYLVAFLSSYLSESLRRTHQRLRETSHDLTELQTFHHNILQSIHSGLLTTDLHGKITSYNKAAEQITGYRLHEVYGLDLQKIFPDIDTTHLIHFLSQTSKDVHRFETTIMPTTRSPVVYLGVSVSLFRDNAQKISGLIFIFQDLTELKAMQERIERANRLAEIGRLAAGVAHEIRNPLASISGAIQMLKSEKLTLTEEDTALMDIILRESRRLDAILTDFLLYARPKAITFGKCDLVHEVILSTMRLLKKDHRFPAEHIEIKIDTEPNFPKIVCDVQQLQQVFWNLFLNAFQAMPEGGSLSIDIRLTTLAEWELGTPTPIQVGMITVRDTGCGIKEEHLQHIFQPFYTTKKNGAGLGLAIVYNIIETHHGSIKVKSSLDQGTTFELVLPLTQEHWS